MKTYLRALRIIGFLSLAFAAPFLTGCGEKEAPKRQRSAQTGSYSADSVFTEVKKKLEKDPNDLEALAHLADLYDRNAQYAEAIETYRKAVALKPDNGYAYFKMATAYDRLNRPEEAIAEFKKAAKYLPDYPVLFNNMGIAYGKLNRLDDEIASLKKAIRLRPSYSAAHYNLGMTYLKKGNTKAALAEQASLAAFDGGAADALMKEIEKKK